MRMPRAVRNVFRSWLSREVFLMSLSCALYLASAVMYYFRARYKIEDRFIVYAFWAAPGVGILGLLSMQRVYILRSVRLWTGARAFSMVFSSAFLLGGMEAVLVLHLFSGKSPEDMIWHFQPVFLAALGLPADTEWRPGSGPAGAPSSVRTDVPSEQYAEATVNLVLGRRPVTTGVRVSDEAIRAVQVWATGK